MMWDGKWMMGELQITSSIIILPYYILFDDEDFMDDVRWSMVDGQIAGYIIHITFSLIHILFWRAVTVLIGYNSPALHCIPVSVQRDIDSC
ncbi:hypothetical protein ACTJKC_23215 [Pedobacter sp. 22226]|uniref:hypothetical protein n=1 Tax=Pedobacter sp. 22226 TaxID=3453894 RepID=UPI003F877CEB